MKISIITVTYNSENTLEETFNSILEQKYRPLEYIVIDGKSTDSTIDLVKKYEQSFKNVGICFSWKSEIDNGISDAFNKGISIATGDLIGIINSDDKLTENSLSVLADNWENSIDVYYGNCAIFNDRKEYFAVPKFSKNEKSLYIEMALYHPSTFISKSAYDKFGIYDLNLKYCMDRDLLLRFYKHNASFKYIDKTLACFREGGTNQVNLKKTAEENENISVNYGISSHKAKVIRVYLMLKTNIWKIIQALRMEKFFHKKTSCIL